MSETQHERRERIKGEVDEDLHKKIPHLLTDIHEESVSGKPETGVPLLRTLARFASLLGVLSYQAVDQAEQSAEQGRANLAMQGKVVALTNRLYWLTLVLTLVALAQITLAYLQLKAAKLPKRDYEHAQSTKASSNEQSLQQKVEPRAQGSLQPPNK